jgi:hypothetical protein
VHDPLALDLLLAAGERAQLVVSGRGGEGDLEQRLVSQFDGLGFGLGQPREAPAAGLLVLGQQAPLGELLHLRVGKRPEVPRCAGFGDYVAVDASASPSAPARPTGCWGPTARARRRLSRCGAACCPPMRADGLGMIVTFGLGLVVAAPVPRGAVLLGEGASRLLIAVVQAAIIVVAGAALFGLGRAIRWRSPPAWGCSCWWPPASRWCWAWRCAARCRPPP